MNSLYQISEDLLAIFANIEANDGEITEDELIDLEIKQEELNEKLTSYKKAIRCWESDIEGCKAEEKRIKNARAIKENRISRLKNNMLNAVLTFGYTGKVNAKGKSNKYYELSDGRLFTRCTESAEINENRTNILINLFVEYCKEDFTANGEIYYEFKFYEDLLNYVNEKVKLYYEGQEEFTMEDLTSCILEYKHKQSIADIYFYLKDVIKQRADNVSLVDLTYGSDTTNLKLRLQAGQELTVAKLKETQSLTIK